MKPNNIFGSKTDFKSLMVLKDSHNKLMNTTAFSSSFLQMVLAKCSSIFIYHIEKQLIELKWFDTIVFFKLNINI
jgi:hypothetical protein